MLNEPLESTPLDNSFSDLVSTPYPTCPAVAKPSGPPDTVVSSNPLTLEPAAFTVTMTPGSFTVALAREFFWLDFSGCAPVGISFDTPHPFGPIHVYSKPDEWIRCDISKSALAGTYKFTVTAVNQEGKNSSIPGSVTLL